MSGHCVPNGNGGWNYVGGYQEPTYLLELQRKEQLMNYINPNWGDRQQEYLEETIVSEDERQKMIEEYEEIGKKFLDNGVEVGREGDYLLFHLDETNQWILSCNGDVVAFWGWTGNSELMQLSQRWLALGQELMDLGAI